MELEKLKNIPGKVIGIRQTLKAVERGQAARVLLAVDAEQNVLRDIVRICEEKKIPLDYAESMTALGKACGIEVGAAAVALILE
jgi:large subunit ribosomal protein L7A